MEVIDLIKDYGPTNPIPGKNQEWYVGMLNKRSPTLEDWMKFEEELHKSWIEEEYI